MQNYEFCMMQKIMREQPTSILHNSLLNWWPNHQYTCLYIKTPPSLNLNMKCNDSKSLWITGWHEHCCKGWVLFLQCSCKHHGLLASQVCISIGLDWFFSKAVQG